MKVRIEFLGLAAAAMLGGCAGTGLTPFPRAVTPDDHRTIGLDPFPRARPSSSREIGLNVFPKVASTGSKRSIGLDPFPNWGGKCGNCEREVKACPAPATAPMKPPPAKAAPAKGTAAAPAPAASPAPAPTLPRLTMKFEKGAVSRYRMSMDTLVKSPMFGEDGMTVKMGMDMKQEVKDSLADGSGVVSSTFEAVSMEMANPFTGSIKVDTRDPATLKEAEENPMLAQMVGGLTSMIGKSIEMTMDRSGRMIAVGNMDEVLGALSEGMGGSMSGQMSGIPTAFPDSPIFEGFSWPYHAEQESMLGNMITDGKMTVKTWDAAKGVATIDYEGVVTSKPSEKKGAAAENDMQAQMAAMIKFKDGKSIGRILFDVTHGRLISSRSTGTMAMENPMLGGDMSVEAKVDLSLIP